MNSRFILALVGTALWVSGGGVLHAQNGSSSGKVPSNSVTVPDKNPVPATGGSPLHSGTGSPIDDKTYVIGPEDVLSVIVWGEPRLTGQVLVRPDGKISMALIDEIEAGGKTPAELQAEINERLKAGDFIKSPLVTVKVDQINSKKYYIQGEVKAPNAYPLIVPTTVLEALVKAGSFLDFANKKKIVILRMEGGKVKQFRFNYNEVIHGKKIEQNIQLKPGDHIIVP